MSAIELDVYLCPECGDYSPITEPGYSGALSGTCHGCQLPKREVHLFTQTVNVRALAPS
jgi:hypothetical protein